MPAATLRPRPPRLKVRLPRGLAAVLLAAAGGALALGANGCASLFNMPSRVSRMSVQVDTLTARQARTEVVVGRISRQVGESEQVVRSTGAGTASKMDELLDRSERVASNLEETTRQMASLQERLNAIEARVERGSGGTMVPPGGGVPADTTGASGGDASRLFGDAAALRARGDLEGAVRGFGRVASLAPKGTLAAEAQYQLGETREAAKAFDLALAAYRKVVTDYPTSPRVPRAMYRAAMVLETLKERSAATETLKSLIDAYPSSPDAASARDHLAATKSGTSRK